MSVAIALVHLLLEAVTQLGSDADLLLSRAGLTRDQLLDAEQRVSEGAWERLQEAALELTGDPALGLHLGERTPAKKFGIIGQLAASCRTLRDCIDVGLTYYPLLVESQRPELRIEAGQGLLVYPRAGSRSRAARLCTEFGMARFAQLGRLFVGGAAASVEVWFEHARPAHAEEYARVFGFNVRFDMPQSGFVIPLALLEFQQPVWDAALHQLLRDEAQRALQRMAARDVSERTRGVLSGLRLGERPEMGDAAQLLGMSERSLRRRLAAEGVCFRELVDHVQRERALVLAQDPRRSAEATSDALGFSEVSAFHRAFKRWTGLTPLQYRLGARPANEQLTSVAS